MTRFFKVNDGKLETLRAWCSLLMSDLKNEAEASLREENVLRERLLLFLDGDNQYYVRGEMEVAGEVLPASKERAINLVHRLVMHSCVEPAEPKEGLTELATLYDVRAV